MRRRELGQSETVRYQERENASFEKLNPERSSRGGRTRGLKYALLLDSCVIFRELLTDSVVGSLQELLFALAQDEVDFVEVYRKYHSFCAAATEVNWPEYLWDLLLASENVFAKQVTFQAWEDLDPGLKDLVIHDLEALRMLANLEPQALQQMIQERVEEQALSGSKKGSEWSGLVEHLPKWVSQPSGLQPDQSRAGQFLAKRREQVKRSLRSGDEKEAARELAKFYSTIGGSWLASSLAFKWDGQAKTLVGVTPDPIRTAQLIGQEREQGIVLENTKFFLKGFPAHNVILYGNRGTGKSSLVKALLQEFCEEGLRLVELSKRDLVDLPLLMRWLKPLPQKFILFIDDLSFEETELEYKALKTLLEGGVEKRPANVLIYATSNRRHLIRENFAERQGDEVHVRDNMDEKLSLADRFGITVTFPSPDQEGYLRIVEELAQQEGLKIDRTELRQQALRWVLLHNARSGRTARQFIDYLVAQSRFHAKP